MFRRCYPVECLIITEWPVVNGLSLTMNHMGTSWWHGNPGHIFILHLLQRMTFKIVDNYTCFLYERRQFSLGILSNQTAYWTTVSSKNTSYYLLLILFIFESVSIYNHYFLRSVSMLECHVLEIQCFNFVKDNNGWILIFPLIIYFASHKVWFDTPSAGRIAQRHIFVKNYNWI